MRAAASKFVPSGSEVFQSGTVKLQPMLYMSVSSAVFLMAAFSVFTTAVKPDFLVRHLRLSPFLTVSPFLSAVVCAGPVLAAADSLLGLTCRVPADLCMALMPLFVLPAGTGSGDRNRFCAFVLAMELVSALFTALYASGIASCAAPYLHPLSACLAAAVSYAGFLCLNGRRQRASSGTSAPLTLSGFLADTLYLCAVCLLLVFSAMSCWLSAMSPETGAGVSAAADAACSVLAAFLFACCLLRRTGNRHFLFLGRFEKRLVWAMQACLGDRSMKADRKDNLYRSVFCRVEEYFRTESPFLDVDISISDVSERVFTNRAYVSRAISECSGTNFRQYVNGYRIRYAMDCFRKNPSLKVSDLSSMSGFRTVASYNMAFRRFVGEVPTDWMRRTGGIMRRNGMKMGMAGLRAG